MKRKNNKRACKIDLQQLPGIRVQRAFIIRIHEARLVTESSKELGILNLAFEMAWKAYRFLEGFAQTNTFDTAMLAMDEVQPEMIVRRDANRDYCDKCRFRADCPMKQDPDEVKARICSFIPLSYAYPIDGFHNPAKQKPVNYAKDDRQAIAEAWELPNN